MLTVVVDEDDQGGADHPGEQVHHGQAEHRRLEQPLPHRHLHVDDRAVGEDGEEAAEAHDDEEEVQGGRLPGQEVMRAAVSYSAYSSDSGSM